MHGAWWGREVSFAGFICADVEEGVERVIIHESKVGMRLGGEDGILVGLSGWELFDRTIGEIWSWLLSFKWSWDIYILGGSQVGTWINGISGTWSRNIGTYQFYSKLITWMCGKYRKLLKLV